MADRPGQDDALQRKPFATTRWSLVLAAGQSDKDSAGEALGQLCEAYWYPLYAFLRRKGHPANEAQDMVQDYFAHVLENETIQKADQSRGRFRTFLLTSMQNFLRNRFRAQTAQKRGGNRRLLSLDFDEGEQKYKREPADTLTAEKVFERRWAMTLLEMAVERLATEQREAGRQEQFDVLKPYLGGGEKGRPYRTIADQLGVSESAVKVAVFRLRKRCREILREEIQQTLGVDSSVDDELRHLFTAISPDS